MTASIGVVSSSGGQGLGTAEQMIEVADEAMYVSKYLGRNRVTAWPIPQDVPAAARAAREKAKGRDAARA